MTWLKRKVFAARLTGHQGSAGLDRFYTSAARREVRTYWFRVQDKINRVEGNLSI